MALDRYIRYSLQNSEDIVQSIPTLEPALRNEAKGKALSELESSVALFTRARNQTNVSRYGSSDGVKSRELLLLSAEAALTNEHYELARKQTHELLLLNPPSDQFLARALFVCAACDAHVVKEERLNGSAAVRQRLKAVDSILAALEIAEAHSPRYDFLVYNSSVHYWTVIRPLIRPGASRFLVPSLRKISESLERLDDKDKPWRIVILIALAQAEDDAGNPSFASKALLEALELCNALHKDSTNKENEAKHNVEFYEQSLLWCSKTLRCIQENKPCEKPPVFKPYSANGQDEAAAAAAAAASAVANTKGEAKGKAKGGKAGKGVAQPTEVVEEYKTTMDEVLSSQAQFEKQRIELLEVLEAKKKEQKSLGRRVEAVLLQAVHVGRHAGKDSSAKELMNKASDQLKKFPKGFGKALLAIQRTKSKSVDKPLVELTQVMDTIDEENFKSASKSQQQKSSSDAGGNGDHGHQSKGRASDELMKQYASVPLDCSSAELAAEIGLAALLLTNEKTASEIVSQNSKGSKNGDDNEEKLEIERAVLLAHRCLSRSLTAKDIGSSTCAIKIDFLKCQLMVLEFEGRDAVALAELSPSATRKEEATKLAQFAIRESSLNSRDGRNTKAKKSPIDYLAEHAMTLASEPLLDKLPSSRVAALQLKQRVEALKLLERALLTCQRLDDEKAKIRSSSGSNEQDTNQQES
jgi:hypothetical protein